MAWIDELKCIVAKKTVQHHRINNEVSLNLSYNQHITLSGFVGKNNNHYTKNGKPAHIFLICPNYCPTQIQQLYFINSTWFPLCSLCPFLPHLASLVEIITITTSAKL